MYFLLILFLIYSIDCHPDQVKTLPGIKQQFSFNHYSGYLNNSRGPLHYWLVSGPKQLSNPRPVIVRVGSAFRCSSMLELFTGGTGPWDIDTNGTISPNNNTWNRHADVLYLEYPGMGYSNDQVNRTFQMMVEDQEAALKHFIKKFPEHDQNKAKFYFTGDAQGSVISTALALKVNSTAGLVLASIPIDDLWPTVESIFYRGLIDQQQFDRLDRECCKCRTKFIKCKVDGNQLNNCTKAIGEMLQMLLEQEVNIENPYKPLTMDKMAKMYQIGLYLNRADVKTALNVGTKKFVACNESDEILYPPFKNLLKEVVSKDKIKVLVLAGDSELETPAPAVQKFLDSLNLKKNVDSRENSYKKWQVGDQTMGFVKNYTKSLSLMTFKAAGATIGDDQPELLSMVIKRMIG